MRNYAINLTLAEKTISLFSKFQIGPIKMHKFKQLRAQIQLVTSSAH